MATRHLVSAALAAALIGGGAPALAQQGGNSSGNADSRWDRGSFESNDPSDAYDRYLRSLAQGRAGDERGQGGQAAMERRAREVFERGYRAGREEERRRQGTQHSGSEGRNQPSSFGGSGRGRQGGFDIDRYLVIPDILPDGPAFRGMQDFALMPDYSQSMDRLRIAAQNLREAMQAMAQQPASDRRNRAMESARDALLETQQSMVQLPSELRTR